jgi:hypothetical protein
MHLGFFYFSIGSYNLTDEENNALTIVGTCKTYTKKRKRERKSINCGHEVS